MTRAWRLFAILLVLGIAPFPVCALSGHEVLVVYNGNSSTPDYAPQFNDVSLTTAVYYAAARGVPARNLLALPLAPYDEWITEGLYEARIASPINSYLSLPENSHIKAIVLCYGVPSRIIYQPNYDMFVDSALALLGNPGVPDEQHWGLNLTNPYCGKNCDFATFRDSAENAIPVTINGQPEVWKLNYLVTRLDGYSTPTEDVGGVEIPRDVKAMIDRAVDVTPGGNFVVDRSQEQVQSVAQSLVSAGFDPGHILSDTGSVFLTNQQDVIGYWGEHMLLDGNANNYTTWTRPLHIWRNGGIAIYNTNDGHSFRLPRYIWGPLNPKPSGVEPGKLKVEGFFRSDTGFTDQYADHQVVLCDKDGVVLKRATFSQGTSTMDLADVAWPSDGFTYMEFHFPVNDPQFPDAYIPSSRTPAIPDDSIYTNRNNGATYHCTDPYNRLARCVSASYIAEGASGTITLMNHLYSAPFVNAPLTFGRYATGYTWAETAYMSLPGLSTDRAVLGDPLMAPFATPPTVTFNQPAVGATVSGTFLATSEAESAPSSATGIAKVEFWLTKTDGTVDKLVGTANEAPFFCTIDSTVVPDGDYLLCAVAYENNGPRENAEIRRGITIANAGNPTTVAITLPQENADLSDSVTVEASVSNQSIVTHVEFWLVGSTYSQLVATDTTYPFSCNLDTTVCGDGAYTIHALAYWTDGGASGVSGSPARSVTISNSGIVSITSPSTDGQLVSGQIAVDVAVDASGQPSVSHVDIHLSGNGVTDTVVGTDATAPYSITINTAVLPDSTPITDGIYSLRAVAYKDGGQQIVNTDARTIIISNDHIVCSRIPAARACSNGTGIALEEKVVSAGTSPVMDSAFYVAESDRSSGLRIAWSGSEIQSGKTVTVLGEIGNNPTTGEREVAAEAVWIGGDASPIKPLAMPNAWIGGASPAGESNTNGLTDGVGLYNIGCLVRVFGTVNYVGEDFVYIDDGSGVQDGNVLAIRPVPLDGSQIPDATVGVKGIRVYFGDFPKPGIDDYVSVKGISSIQDIGGNRIRLIRVADESAITYYEKYTTSFIGAGGFWSLSQELFQEPGSKVRLLRTYVDWNYGMRLHILETPPNVPYGAEVPATTALQQGDYITVTGVVGDWGSWGRKLIPNHIFLDSTEQSGLLNMAYGDVATVDDGKLGGGPFRPWPYPTAEETLASDRFKELYSQVGAIGWAISQPDGSIVDLPGEQVILASADGKTIGLKEPFEPAQNAPKLVLLLDNPVERLRQWSTIDIIGGTITTLPNGQRAIVRPQSVYAYVDAIGRYTTTWSKVSYRQDNTSVFNGLWRVQVAP